MENMNDSSEDEKLTNQGEIFKEIKYVYTKQIEKP